MQPNRDQDKKNFFIYFGVEIFRSKKEKKKKQNKNTGVVIFILLIYFFVPFYLHLFI